MRLFRAENKKYSVPINAAPLGGWRIQRNLIARLHIISSVRFAARILPHTETKRASSAIMPVMLPAALVQRQRWHFEQRTIQKRAAVSKHHRHRADNAKKQPNNRARILPD